SEEVVEARCTAFAHQGQCLQARGGAAWPDGTVTAWYGFKHVLYHEVLYQRLPVGLRTRWHARIGTRLAQGFGAWRGGMAGGLGDGLPGGASAAAGGAVFGGGRPAGGPTRGASGGGGLLRAGPGGPAAAPHHARPARPGYRSPSGPG